MQKALPALPSTLAAGLCSVCVVASVGAVAPSAPTHSVATVQAAAARTVEQQYFLTANALPLTALLEIPALLWQDFSMASQLIGADVIDPVFALSTHLYNAVASGDFTALVQNIQQDIQNEITGFGKLITIPATIINYDIDAIHKLFNPAAATSTAATPAAAASTALVSAAATPSTGTPNIISGVTSVLTALLSVPALLWQDFSMASQLVGGYVIDPVFALSTHLYNAVASGDFTTLVQNIQQDIQNEITGFGKLITIPATIINYDIDAIHKIFNPAAATSSASISSVPKALTSVAALATKPVEASTSADETGATPSVVSSEASAKSSEPAPDITKTEAKATKEVSSTNTESGTAAGSTTTSNTGAADPTAANPTGTTGAATGTAANSTGTTGAATGTTGSATANPAGTAGASAPNSGDTSSSDGKHKKRNGQSGSSAATSGASNSTGGKHRKADSTDSSSHANNSTNSSTNDKH